MHLAFFADWTGNDIDTADPKQLLLPGFRSVFFFCCDFASAKELTAQRDVVFAFSVCQQAVMAEPDISIRQYMKKESSDELVDL